MVYKNIDQQIMRQTRIFLQYKQNYIYIYIYRNRIFFISVCVYVFQLLIGSVCVSTTYWEPSSLHLAFCLSGLVTPTGLL